jgi:hypothetical protein
LILQVLATLIGLAVFVRVASWTGLPAQKWVLAVSLGFAVLFAVALIVIAVTLNGLDQTAGPEPFGRRARRAVWDGHLNLPISWLVILPLLVLLFLFWRDSWYRFFWLVRVADLSSGLSPLVPTIILATLLFVVGFYQLRQLRLGRDFYVPCPFDKGWACVSDWRSEILDQDHRYTEYLQGGRLWPEDAKQRWTAALIMLPLLVFAAWFCSSFHSTIEGPIWDGLLRFLFWLSGAMLAYTLTRFLGLWAGLKRLLGELGKVRMAVAFERLPDKVRREFRDLLYSQRPHVSHLRVALQQLTPAHRQIIGSLLPERLWLLPLFDLPPLLPTPAAPTDHDERQAAELDEQRWLTRFLCRISARFAEASLSARWAGRTTDEAFGLSEAPKAKSGEAGEPTENRDESAHADREDDHALGDGVESFVATMVVIYLSQFFVQIRQLAWALTIGSPLLLIAAASYPFQPERPLITALIGLLAAVMAGIIYVLYDINRNEVVSRITHTPSRFTLDREFLGSVGATVLPILGVIVAHLLGVFRIVFDPILGSLR